MFDRTTRKYYDYTDTLRDRNDVISDVLNVIDKIILFKFSNYFLKVAKAYKAIRKSEGRTRRTIGTSLLNMAQRTKGP